MADEVGKEGEGKEKSVPDAFRAQSKSTVQETGRVSFSITIFIRNKRYKGCLWIDTLSRRLAQDWQYYRPP